MNISLKFCYEIEDWQYLNFTQLFISYLTQHLFYVVQGPTRTWAASLLSYQIKYN
jgi:hypothetical protein